MVIVQFNKNYQHGNELTVSHHVNVFKSKCICVISYINKVIFKFI